MVVRKRRSTVELAVASPAEKALHQLKLKLPILDWLPLYSVAKFQSDVVAGLTVGLMVVPQSLSYATNIAGLPARYGLYSSYVGVIVYMFFGTSKDVTLGPTAIMSKIVSQATKSGSLCHSSTQGAFHGISNCAALAAEPRACCNVVAKATKLCVLGGLLNLLMGFLSLGFIVDFISYPVLAGFTTSASVTIAVGQVHSFVGLGRSKSFIAIFSDIFGKVNHWRYPDMLMAVLCIVTTILLQKLKGRMEKNKNPSMIQKFLWFLGAAGNFFTVMLGTIIGIILHSSQPSDSNKYICFNHDKNITQLSCLTLVGDIIPGLPTPEAPPFDFAHEEWGDLISGAIVVAMIGYLESIAIAKAFARSNGYEVDTTQELVAIGASNVASGFFQAYPSTGSFSRTAVNSSTGVATPLSGLVTGSIVILSLQFLTTVLCYIPKASLGAIIVVSVLKMFNYELVLKLWRVNKIELLPWAVSFFGCTFSEIQFGVMGGAALHILILLYYQARPNFESKKSNSDLNIRIMKISSSPLYPAGAAWKDKVRATLDDRSLRGLVLDMTSVARLDYTGLQSLSNIAEDCKSEKVKLQLANVHPNVVMMLTDFHYFDTADQAPHESEHSTNAAVDMIEQLYTEGGPLNSVASKRDDNDDDDNNNNTYDNDDAPLLSVHAENYTRDHNNGNIQ